MTIEVKQLIIKSTVLNEPRVEERRDSSRAELEKLRAAILKECRELIAEQRVERRER